MIKFEYINEFLVLAQTLSFSKAAEITYISQPAISRHIAAIEEEMGAKLFERTTRSVWLTPAGEVVRDQFKNIMESYDFARQQVDRLSEDSAGLLTACGPHFLEETYTEPIVAALLEASPSAEVHIESTDPDSSLALLAKGRGDVCVDMFKGNIDAAVRRVPFAQEPLAVAVCEGHRLCGRESVRMEELGGETFVVRSLNQSDYGNFNSLGLDLLAKRGIHPAQLVYAHNESTMGLVCRKSNGVCIVPYSARYSTRSYFHVVPFEDEDCRLTMCVYYRMDNANRLIPKFVRTACELGESARFG